ncbi:hypothetical protein CRG98_015621 [Punica granatum]|uniref:Uncharacterized protein n=1 Tax=Punica granatum TaxID=22663 RepID=A0A2I0K5X8_PUNGR|nr:hypothetical protein CRG98_015621 [Punica granatum]
MMIEMRMNSPNLCFETPTASSTFAQPRNLSMPRNRVAGAVPCPAAHELQRQPVPDRPQVQLAQRPQLQHHPGPALDLPLPRPRGNNETSFFYRLDPAPSSCSVQLEVGILRPNWLDGAT